MTHSVKRLALDFTSGHDLTLHEFEPCIRLLTGRAEPVWDSLSVPPLLVFSLSLSLSK